MNELEEDKCYAAAIVDLGCAGFAGLVCRTSLHMGLLEWN